MEKYIINKSTRCIHNGTNPCYQVKNIDSKNRIELDDYIDARNYFGRDIRCNPCKICLPDKQ